MPSHLVKLSLQLSRCANMNENLVANEGFEYQLGAGTGKVVLPKTNLGRSPKLSRRQTLGSIRRGLGGLKKTADDFMPTI